MRKLIIALVMTTIAISLFISSVNAANFGTQGYAWQTQKTANTYMIVPHPSSTASGSAVWQTFLSSYNDTALNSISILVYETGAANAYYLMALYTTSGEIGSSTPNTLIETSTTEFNPTSIAAGSANWVTFNFSGATTLYADILYSFVFYEKNETTADASNYPSVCLGQAGTASVYYQGDLGYYYSSGWQSGANDFHVIFYLTVTGGVYVEYIGGDYYYSTQNTVYNVTASTADMALTIQSPTEDLMFYTLLTLTFACIILMLKSGIPLINFVFGTMTLGLATFSLTNPDIAFFGYIQMFAMLMSVLTMLSGYRSYRNE